MLARTRRFVRSAAALVAAVTASATTAAAQIPAFGPPAPLNSESDAASHTATYYFQNFATDGAGHWIAIWGHQDGDLRIARSADDGISWTAPATLYADPAVDGTFALIPAIASDGAGTWVAVWTVLTYAGTTRTDDDLLTARSTDDGATWSVPVSLNTDAASDGRDDGWPQIATDRAGTWVAVWHSSSGQIFSARSTDAGVTWSAPAALHASALGYLPRIATGAGSWVVVWERRGSGDSDVMSSHSSDGGVTWSAAVPVNADAAVDTDYDLMPHVAADASGTVVAVWTLLHYPPPDPDDSLSERDVLVARSTDGGATWSAPAPLNTNAATDSGDDDLAWVATDGSGAWIAAWTSYDTLGGTLAAGYGHILQARSTDGGLSWSAPTALSTDAFDECRYRDYFDVRLAAGTAGVWLALWSGGTKDCPVDYGDLLFARASTACGNGTVDPGESCDDGGVAAGDGCDPSCHVDPPCRPTPDASCRGALGGKTSLKIRRDPVNPYKNRFDWKYRGLEAVTKNEFGTPTVNNSYHVCVYQAGSLVSTTRIGAAVSCSGKPCWRDTATGFAFKDKMLTQDGALQLDMRAGAAEKATIRFAGRGAPFEMPALPATSPIVVQLRRSNDPFCWSATFSAPFTKSDASILTDKAD